MSVAFVVPLPSSALTGASGGLAVLSSDNGTVGFFMAAPPAEGSVAPGLAAADEAMAVLLNLSDRPDDGAFFCPQSVSMQ